MVERRRGANRDRSAGRGLPGAADHAGDPGFGASFAQRALDAGAGVEASLLLARALTVQSQFEQAEAVLVAAEGTVQTQTDAFEYLQQQSEVLHRGLGRPAELRELLDRAAGWWPDPTWHERLEPLRLLLSQFEEFRGGLSRPAQVLTDADLDPELRSRLEPIQVANLFYSGPSSMNGRARRSMRPSVSPTTRPRVRLPYSLACLRTMAGRYVDAGLLLAESEAQFERHDPLGLLCVINAQQMIVAAARGERAAMSSALERCIERLGGSEPLPHQMPYVIRARAWVSHAGGEHRLAQQQLLDAARLLA